MQLYFIEIYLQHAIQYKTDRNVLSKLTLLSHWQFWFITIFDKFVIESENSLPVLHLKDELGYFVIATANSPRICS